MKRLKEFAEIGNGQATDAEHASPAPPVSIPLYVAGAIAQSAGLAAVSFQLGQPSFAAFTIGLTMVGFLSSYLLRRLGTKSQLLKSGTILLGLIFLYALRGAGVFGALVPPEEVGSQEMLIVSALAFTATFGSFLMITDDAIVFTCVWAIAMIGLTGTVNINRELPICFVVFLAAASFLLVHQNALSFGGSGIAPGNGSHRSGIPWGIRWPLLRTHLTMAGAAWCTALILGVLIAIPVQMVGRNMSLGAIIQQLRVPPAPAGGIKMGQRLVFDNPNQFNVGVGPVDDDPTERLSVWTDRPQYWRGRTYDLYNGHSWTSSFIDRPPSFEIREGTPTPASGNYEFDLVAFIKETYGEEPPRQRTELITNTFHVNAGTFGPLYHAAEPQKVRSPLYRLFVRPDHTLGGGRGMSTDYEVDSSVTVARPSDLRKASTDYPEEIRRQYLSYGPYYNDALRDLAQEAIGDFTTPYDKASAIRRFVATRCMYTREARAVPKDADAAEYFLNESREGYCDLYATAVAILCRYVGLPSRVVTGFAPGLPAEDNTEPPPGGRNDQRLRYVLRGTDQHAWAEVYFTGYGWIVMDATTETGGTTPVARTPEPEKKEPSLLAKLWERRMPIVLISLGLFAVGFVVYNELRGGGLRAHRRSRVILPAQQHAAAVHHTYAQALKRLGRWGIARGSSYTTGEYLAAVRAGLGESPAAPFATLTRLTEKALYGPASVTEDDVAAARTARAELDTALKQTPKPPRRKGKETDAATPR